MPHYNDSSHGKKPNNLNTEHNSSAKMTTRQQSLITIIAIFVVIYHHEVTLIPMYIGTKIFKTPPKPFNPKPEAVRRRELWKQEAQAQEL